MTLAFGAGRGAGRAGAVGRGDALRAECTELAAVVMGGAASAIFTAPSELTAATLALGLGFAAAGNGCAAIGGGPCPAASARSGAPPEMRAKWTATTNATTRHATVIIPVIAARAQRLRARTFDQS